LVSIGNGAGAHVRPIAFECAISTAGYFVTQNFRFQSLRALMEIPAGSADTNEVLETLKLMVDGDVQSWYAGWSAFADRVFAMAERTKDKLSSGQAPGADQKPLIMLVGGLVPSSKSYIRCSVRVPSIAATRFSPTKAPARARCYARSRPRPYWTSSYVRMPSPSTSC
jgi:hypothetical protein